MFLVILELMLELSQSQSGDITYSYRHGSLEYQKLLNMECSKMAQKSEVFRAGRLQYITILFLSLDALLGK